MDQPQNATRNSPAFQRLKNFGYVKYFEQYLKRNILIVVLKSYENLYFIQTQRRYLQRDQKDKTFTCLVAQSSML